MAKTISREYRIIYDKDGKKVVRHLSHKESTKEKVASSFYWEEKIQALRYLKYMECKENGTSYEMGDLEPKEVDETANDMLESILPPKVVTKKKVKGVKKL